MWNALVLGNNTWAFKQDINGQPDKGWFPKPPEMDHGKARDIWLKQKVADFKQIKDQGKFA